MTTPNPSILPTSSVTISLPRSVARPFGILDRETAAHFSPSDEAWLTRNIKDRMTKRQCRVMAQALTDAGVSL